jgi:hypothetical protein
LHRAQRAIRKPLFGDFRRLLAPNEFGRSGKKTGIEHQQLIAFGVWGKSP